MVSGNSLDRRTGNGMYDGPVPVADGHSWVVTAVSISQLEWILRDSYRPQANVAISSLPIIGGLC